MQSVQRKFGKPRTADESQVAVLLKDFDDADKMLARVRYDAALVFPEEFDTQCFLDNRSFESLAGCLG